MSRPDRYTHTEADAAAYERATADYDDYDRPTVADLTEPEQAEWAAEHAAWLRGRRG